MTVSDRSGVPRSYRMRKRQEDIEVTRQRIVDAAVLLHGTVGPAHTTISAVAEQAGVQRSTVYRHFPDEAALFGACTGHWLAANPWPRPQDWERIADPAERMHRGLRELYRYYDENRQMLGNSFRDIEVMPPFVGEMARATLLGLVTGLISGWPEAQQSERLVAAVRGAVDFRTSRAFVEAGLAPAAAADLVADMVLGVVEPG
ncbi:MAG TPA: TetR/AcrR family transcriptional regulator [Tepidiformaceae bacterium]|nr:TetR/AcrR family transcriptional regulator [Tepidiformaceae bacterium]